MPTTTTTYSFNKPVVGADEDDWGGYLNGNWDSVDDLLDGTTPITGIDINSGTLDGVTIGGTTAGAITGTTGQFNTSLNVDGTVTADGLTVDGGLTLNADLDVAEVKFQSTANAKVKVVSSTTGNSILMLGDTDDNDIGMIDYDNADNSMRFVTNTAERMRIDSSGNVGIGVSSPASTLEVNGDTGLIVHPTTASTTGVIEIAGTRASGASPVAVTKLKAIPENPAGNSDAASLAFETRSSSGTVAERMRIDSSGRVGIGTTSPSAALDVLNGSGDGEVAVFSGTDSDRGLSISTFAVSGFGQTGVDLNAQYSSSPTMTLSTGGSEAMRIDSTGNVGIGTSSPLRQLQVGDYSGNADLALGASTTGISSLYFSDGDGAPNRYVGSVQYNHASNYMLFNTSGSERMRIDSGGNLLVGKTSTALGLAGVVAYGGSGAGVIGMTSSTRPLYINKLTSDGGIIELAKDGSTVGSIGVDQFDNFTVTSERELIISTDRTVARSYVLGDGGTSNGVFYPVTDNDADLGQSGKRWNDLYLGGGVYLGGTGSANKLEDYEEGTWTPTLYGHTTTGTTSGTLNGKYTKIGRKVFATVQITAVSLSGAGGRLYMGGLPFTSVSGAPGGGLVTYMEGFNPAYFYTADSDSSALSVVVVGSGTHLVFRPSVTQSWDNFVNAATSTWNNGGGSVYGSLQFTYMTS